MTQISIQRLIYLISFLRNSVLYYSGKNSHSKSSFLMVEVQHLNHVSPVLKWNYFTQKIFKEHNYLKSKTKNIWFKQCPVQGFTVFTVFPVFLLFSSTFSLSSDERSIIFPWLLDEFLKTKMLSHKIFWIRFLKSKPQFILTTKCYMISGVEIAAGFFRHENKNQRQLETLKS